jgi:antagonist of KipI
MNNYFKVLRPGINSTFQDLGRFGLQHLGIVASGCMDQLSFCVSNKLVGNKVSEGALEFAYQGPLLELVGEIAVVAVTGKVNFNVIKKNGDITQGVTNESIVISNGDKLDILSTINSVYGYFAIKGGFKLKEIKGSVSTLVRANIGPNNGHKLNSEDKIFFNTSSSTDKIKKIQLDLNQNNEIRVMKGLQVDYFSKKSQEDFLSKEYEVTRLTDRMGMRLKGQKMENIINKNIKSEGITKGSIQIPGDGQPIVLLSDHPTIGGYPKIANVISADYDKLVQKTPGTKIKFKLVDLTIAESAFQEYVRKF